MGKRDFLGPVSYILQNRTSVLSGTSPFYIIHDTRDPLLWRAVLAEGSATAAFTFFLLSVCHYNSARCF